MIARLFNFQNKTITSAALLLGGSALISRFLGIVRDPMLAAQFGAGKEVDAYLAAFRIPDFLYAFLVIWGLSAVFLPLFSEYMEHNAKEAWRFVNNLMNVYVALLAAGTLIAFLFMPRLIALVAPGFEGSQLDTTVFLSRIMLLSPLFFTFSAITSGVLQYYQRFLAYALAPVLYNLSIIAGILFLTPFFGIAGVAMGVVIGAVLHFLIQIPSLLTTEFSWKPEFSFFDPKVRRAVLLSLPRTIGGVAHQINLIVMTAFASLLPVGSITLFAFAEHMYYFPVGIVGVSLATAAFPLLSKTIAKMDTAEFARAFLDALKRVVAITIPLAAVLFLSRDFLFGLYVRSGEVFFQSDKFTASDAEIAASLLGVFAIGIVFQAVIPLLVRAFFALQNTVVPTIAGVSAVVLNIGLAKFFLDSGWGIFALPWALITSGAFQAILLSVFLFFSLRKRFQHARED